MTRLSLFRRMERTWRVQDSANWPKWFVRSICLSTPDDRKGDNSISIAYQTKIIRLFHATQYNTSFQEYAADSSETMCEDGYSPDEFLQDLHETQFGQMSTDQMQSVRELLYWYSRFRDPQRVHNAFALLDRISIELDINTELRGNWYDGKSPMGTRLLNAVLDAYCDCWIQQGNKSRQRRKIERQKLPTDSSGPPIDQPLPSPGEIYTKLQGLETLSYPTDCRSYSLVMKAATRARGRTCEPPPLLCENILRHMLERGVTYKACLPDTIALTTALQAWGSTAREDAATRAETLWRQIMQLFDDLVLTDRPNAVFYHSVLEVFAKANHRLLDEFWSFMELSETILNDMIHSPYPGVSPTDAAFRLVVHGWLQLAARLSKKKDDSTTQYAPMDAVKKSVDLVRLGLELESQGTQLIDSTLASKVLWSALEVSASTKDFEMVEQIYVELFASENATLQVDGHALRAMIVLHCRVGQPEKAQEYLLELEALVENAHSSDQPQSSLIYRELIWAWMKSGNPQGIDHAEKLLMHMLDLTRESGIKQLAPDRRTVSRVMEGLSKLRTNEAANRTENILNTLQSTFEETKMTELSPRGSFYLYVLQAWSRSKDIRAGSIARSILRKLEELYQENPVPHLAPTRFHYQAALEAIGARIHKRSVKNAQEVFHRAREAFQCRQSNLSLEHVDAPMYSSLIRVCVKAGDDEAALRAFEEMHEDYKKGNRSAKPCNRILKNVLLACLTSKSHTAKKNAETAIAIAQKNDCTGPDEHCLQLFQEVTGKRMSS